MSLVYTRRVSVLFVIKFKREIKTSVLWPLWLLLLFKHKYIDLNHNSGAIIIVSNRKTWFCFDFRVDSTINRFIDKFWSSSFYHMVSDSAIFNMWEKIILSGVVRVYRPTEPEMSIFFLINCLWCLNWRRVSLTKLFCWWKLL